MANRNPFEITPEVLSRVHELAKDGLNDEQIAQYFGYSRSTITRKKRDNEAFAAALKKGKAKGDAAVMNVFYQKCMQGDNACLIFFLKNRLGWRDRTEPETFEEPPPLNVRFSVRPAKEEIKTTNARP